MMEATGPATGPLGTCASCATTGRMHVHFADGWLCRRCYLSASTVIEWRWINGRKFARCLKGVKALAPVAKAVAS